MNALSLFSGIGGIDLAGEWIGIKTVAFCEKDAFCQKTLRKHWPNVPIFDDVFQINKSFLIEKGVMQNEASGAIDLITGGFP